MSSREERPGSWRADVNDAPTVGSEEQDAILESLATSLPPEIERDRHERSQPGPAPGPSYSSVPRRSSSEPVVGLDPAPPVLRRKPGLRRVKRTLRHVDPISIFKLSLFFSACLLVVWLLFVAILYWLADARGLFDVIDELREGFALDWQEDITLMYVEKWAFLIGFTVAVMSSLLALFLAFIYNVGSDFLGGAETTWVERES